MEAKARRALVKVLRNNKPLHRRIRRWLAAHFDDADSYIERKLVFQFRKSWRPRGRRQVRDASVRHLMYEMVHPLDGRKGCKVEAAVAAAMEKFKLSRRTVLAIWSQGRVRRLVFVSADK
jgi:hypothetical protein